MSMMGSAPTGGGGELSFVDVIGMLKDEPAYQTKLREIGNRLNETRALKEQTAAINAKMEETKKFTAEMAAKAEAQLVEARQLKDEADKKVAAAGLHESELISTQEKFKKEFEAKQLQMEQHYRGAFATREKEVQAKEQKLLADLKVFEGRKADEIAVETAFAAAKQETEIKLARREATLREGEARLIANLQEVEATRLALKVKLDKIKAISVG